MLWLAGGISFGLLAGFVAGLSQPRDQLQPPGPDVGPDSGQNPGPDAGVEDGS